MKFNFNKTANFDEENLDNIWVVDMWLDNMDSKDGHDHIEFTKIGLIDFLNNEMEDYNSTNGADYTVLDRNATNKEVKEVLYDLLEGKVVEIKPYNEKTASKKVKSDKEKTIQEYEEMGLDMSDLMKACVYVYYGFYDEIKKKWSPEKLYYYLEERLKEAQDNPQTAKFEKNWTSTRFPEALKLILHWFDTNVETTWKDLGSQASKEVKSANIEYKTEEIMNYFRNKNKKVFNWFDEDNGSVIKNGNDIYIETHSFGNVPNYIYNAVKDWAFSNGYSFYTKTANKKCAAVTKQIGRWLLKLVKAGETTNRGNGEFINKGKGDEYDMVEIYDTKAEPGKFTEYGQFVSDYYVSTFLKHNGGLSMVGYVPAWTMSAAEVKEAQEWLKSLYSNGTPKDFLEETMAEFRKKNKTAKKQIKAEKEPKVKIDVLFKFEQTADDKIDIVAWFVNVPDICYTHFGQYSSCDPEYMASLEDADFESYEYTLKDLESIGYEVNVMNGDYKQQKKASRKFTFNKASKEDSGLILDKEYANFNYSVGEDGTMYIYAPDGRTINEISDCEDKNTKELEDLMLEVLDNSSFSRFNKKNVSKKSSRKFTFNKASKEVNLDREINSMLKQAEGNLKVYIYKVPETTNYEYVKKFNSIDDVKTFLLNFNKEGYSFAVSDGKSTLGGGKLPITNEQLDILLNDSVNFDKEINSMLKQASKKVKSSSKIINVDVYNMEWGYDSYQEAHFPTAYEDLEIEIYDPEEAEDLDTEIYDSIEVALKELFGSAPLSFDWSYSKKKASKKVKSSKIGDKMKERLTFGYFSPEQEKSLPNFNSTEELESYIKQTNSFPDNFFYKGGLFTMDEYDMSGSTISYSSPEIDMGLEINTPDNRYDYKGNYKNMEISIEEENEPLYRNDITYYLPKSVYDSLYGNKSASIKRKAGTGNFATQEGYPLIAIGNEQVYPIKSYIEDYNESNPEEPITEENMADHYEDYGDILTDLYREVTNEMETYLKNADIPYGWNITIEPGYYEGAQLYVEEPDDFEYNFENDWLYDNELAYGELTPEQKAELQNAMQAQYEKEKAQVEQIMIDAAKACGWLQLKVDWRASNGETGYSVVKSGLSESGVEKLKQVSEVVETKNNIAILKSKMTGNYILFDYNTNDFLDDELYSDLASAESALEDYTEEIGNDILSDLADDLVLDIKDVNAVKEKLATVSKDNSDYGKIEEEQIADIARETGVNNTDVKTIALELGYMVK